VTASIKATEKSIIHFSATINKIGKLSAAASRVKKSLQKFCNNKQIGRWKN
jgi:hypothetical protein